LHVADVIDTLHRGEIPATLLNPEALKGTAACTVP